MPIGQSPGTLDTSENLSPFLMDTKILSHLSQLPQLETSNVSDRNNFFGYVAFLPRIKMDSMIAMFDNVWQNEYSWRKTRVIRVNRNVARIYMYCYNYKRAVPGRAPSSEISLSAWFLDWNVSEKVTGSPYSFSFQSRKSRTWCLIKIAQSVEDVLALRFVGMPHFSQIRFFSVFIRCIFRGIFSYGMAINPL